MTTLTDLRVFLWQETLSPIAVSKYEGLFLFNITYKDMGSPRLTRNESLSLRFVTKFKLKSLCYGPILDLVSDIISRNEIVAPEAEGLLIQQVSDYILSCFRFRPPLVKDLDCPRLVFVVDVSHSGFETLIHCLTRLSINTTGQPMPSHKMIQKRDQRDSNVDQPMIQQHHEALIRTLQHEEVTDCLNANEASEEEFKDILNLLRNMFNHKELKSSSLYKTLRKVRPTLEIIQTTRDVEDQQELVGDKLERDNVCSICLENISREVEVVKMVRCKHVFHRRCVFKWLSSHQSCPYCRTSSVTNVYL